VRALRQVEEPVLAITGAYFPGVRLPVVAEVTDASLWYWRLDRRLLIPERYIFWKPVGRATYGVVVTGVRPRDGDLPGGFEVQLSPNIWVPFADVLDPSFFRVLRDSWENAQQSPVDDAEAD
jgi:hypothetical protein